MVFKCEKILDDNDINFLVTLSRSCKWKEIYQLYNVFKCNIGYTDGRESLINEKMKTHLGIDFDCDVLTYFLDYVPGSFTRPHFDVNTEYSVITVLEQNNLVGGYSVFYDNYLCPEGGRDGSLVCERDDVEKENPPYNKPIIPVVVSPEVGDSLVYNKKARHGVSKVESGNRLVFVSWFRKK